MPQDDYSLANASGSAFRADANNQLAAIREMNSGSGFPSSVAANMAAAHTVDGIRYRRDNANTAWLPEASLSADLTEEKTTAYTVTLADFGKMLEGNPSSANFDFDLPAVAGVPDGWHCWVRNGSMTKFDIVLDPSGSEQIDDANNVQIPMMQGCLLWCTGAEWKTLRMPKSGMELMDSATAAGDALKEFATSFETNFDYEIHISNLKPSSDDVPFNIQLSIAGVFQVGNGDYSWHTVASDTDSTILNEANKLADVSASRMRVGLSGAQFGNGLGEESMLRVVVADPMNTADKTYITWQGGGYSSDNEPMWLSGWGQIDASGATDGIRFSFNAGNIATGDFRLRRMQR